MAAKHIVAMGNFIAKGYFSDTVKYWDIKNKITKKEYRLKVGNNKRKYKELFKLLNVIIQTNKI